MGDKLRGGTTIGGNLAWHTGNLYKAVIDAMGITAANVVDNSINSGAYVDGSIDRVHLAADVIDSTKVANDAIGNEHIKDNAINSEHYVDGSIDRVHLAADIIDGTKIANDSINSEHYVAGSIDNEHIADNAINSEHYADNSIDALHLNVSGNGTTSQYLRSDGDGTMSWVTPPNTNTHRGIDDIPVNGQTGESISSNWAYDHNAASQAHPRDARNLASGSNAVSATKLATARTIDITGDITATAVSFNGTANISISAAVNNDSHTHSEGTISGTTAATASTVAQRDGSADISARLFRSNYGTASSLASTADICFRNDTSDNYMRFVTRAGFATWLEAETSFKGYDSARLNGQVVTTSTSSTSTTVPASLSSVKSAYDRANDAHGRAFAPNKNVLINGGMEVWQRGGNYPDVFDNSGGGVVYTADRWWLYQPGGDVQVYRGGTTDPTVLDEFRGKSFVHNVTYGGFAGRIGQYIENVRTLSGKKATLSMWLNGINAAKTFDVRLTQNFDSSSGYFQLPTQSVTADYGVWKKVTLTFDVPSIDGMSIGANSYLALEIYSGNATGRVDFNNIQLEEGEVATDFEYRDVGTELSLCQRYYSTGYDRWPVRDAAYFGATHSFPTTMRHDSVDVVITEHYTDTGNTNLILGNLNAFIRKDNFTSDVLPSGDWGNWCEIGWTADAEVF